ncbi:MAG: PAS domain-containing protein [Flavobacterium sp.]
MKKLPEINYRALFDSAPTLYMILLPDFTILEVSPPYAEATLTKREEIRGRKLFEVFPDNPLDHTADGVANLRSSLEYVLRNKIAHTMAVQKYDVRNDKGEFQLKYWTVLNKPVFDENGELLYILHRAEDVTDFVKEKDLKEELASEFQSKMKEMEREVIKTSREIQKLNAQLEAKVTERTNHLKEANENNKEQHRYPDDAEKTT